MNEAKRGVFWLIDEELLCFPFNGNAEYGVAKSGNTYNHKLLWEHIRPKGCNKPYNYYPRGRVEIGKGKAVLWLNPRLAANDTVELIKKEFELGGGSIIICVKPDHSKHYECGKDFE